MITKFTKKSLSQEVRLLACSQNTVPRAGTLIGTLKANKVPSRDMGLTTDIQPCAQIVSEWLSAVSYNAYMLAKRASAGEVAYFGACHF
jgi:hypothetical protein